MTFKIARFACLALPLCLLAACTESEDGDVGPGCDGAKCDDLGELGEVLAKFNDPIATWLRANLDAKGQFEVEYLDMLKAIAKQQGCDDASIDSYVISDLLVADSADAFPRVVNTVCSKDRTKADLAFFALSFGNADLTDLDPREIEMFAWDATDRKSVV